MIWRRSVCAAQPLAGDPRTPGTHGWPPYLLYSPAYRRLAEEGDHGRADTDGEDDGR
ncbi:hypothetical protein HC928_21880 [bacterium]|nr:hypothetical protein [bacterium]